MLLLGWETLLVQLLVVIWVLGKLRSRAVSYLLAKLSKRTDCYCSWLGTLVGRHILKAAADSNLKKVTLELGGKSPTLILDDSNLDDAIKWAAFGVACVFLRLFSLAFYLPMLSGA